MAQDTVSAIIQSQVTPVEEQDSSESALARQGIVKEQMETVAEWCGKIKKIEYKNRRLRNENKTWSQVWTTVELRT